MRPQRTCLKIRKKNNFQFFHIYLPGQTIQHECFQKSFCLSNTDYAGLKTYIHFHLVVDIIYFDSFQREQPYPLT